MGLIGVSLLATAAAGCGSASTGPQAANNDISAGLRAQLSGDLATAQTDYMNAIHADGTSSLAYYDLGTVYDAQGNHQQAASEYQAAININPNYADALYNLAVDTAASNPSNAEQLYRQVVADQPNYAAAWLNLGFLLMAEGKNDEARADWQKAVMLQPSLASRLPAGALSPAPSASASPSPSAH